MKELLIIISSIAIGFFTSFFFGKKAAKKEIKNETNSKNIQRVSDARKEKNLISDMSTEELDKEYNKLYKHK